MPGLLADIRDGLRGHAGRTLLSFTAIALGMASLTVLLCVIEGLREQARRAIEELGVHAFALLPSPHPAAPGSGATACSEAVVEILRRNLSDGRVTALQRLNDVLADGQGERISIIATDEHLAAVRGWTLSRGRFLDALDRQTQARSMVITEALARQANWDVGRLVTIGGVPFTVVGVLSDAGISTEEASSAQTVLPLGDRVAFVPRPTAHLWRRRNEACTVDAILVRAAALEAYEGTLSQARRLLSAPNLPPFQWITPETLVRPVRHLERAVAFTAGIVSLLCLALGGVTLMSLMIANVRDRASEIGLRRALGARPREVAALFVLEALLVTFAGALAGTTIAWALLRLFASQAPMPLSFGLLTWILPWLAALALSGLFSYAPARLAARMHPADALRTE